MKPFEAPSRRNGRGTRPGVALPLLLERRLDLRAGQVHVHQGVGERLDRRRPACRSASAGRVTRRTVPSHVGAQATRVHERDLRRAGLGARVAQRWTSATRLPRVDSPPRFSVVPLASLARLNGPSIWPRAPGTEHGRLRPPRRPRSPVGRVDREVAAGPPQVARRFSASIAWSWPPPHRSPWSTVNTSWSGPRRTGRPRPPDARSRHDPAQPGTGNEQLYARWV